MNPPSSERDPTLIGARGSRRDASRPRACLVERRDMFSRLKRQAAGPPTQDAVASRLTRRSLLHWFSLAALATLADERVRAALMPLVRGRGLATIRRDELSDADRELATLGRLLDARAPGAARELLQYTEGCLRQEAPRSCGESPAWQARRVLLAPERVRQDFEDGHVIAVDGWLLSRSEAGLCIYLHSLDVHADRET